MANRRVQIDNWTIEVEGTGDPTRRDYRLTIQGPTGYSNLPGCTSAVLAEIARTCLDIITPSAPLWSDERARRSAVAQEIQPDVLSLGEHIVRVHEGLRAHDLTWQIGPPDVATLGTLGAKVTKCDSLALWEVRDLDLGGVALDFKLGIVEASAHVLRCLDARVKDAKDRLGEGT
jgi:hypothetical protein